MDVEQLKKIQIAAKARWGISVGSFAEELLFTPYDTYARWTGTRKAKPPGSVQTGCAFVQFALDNEWSLEQLKKHLSAVQR